MWSKDAQIFVYDQETMNCFQVQLIGFKTRIEPVQTQDIFGIHLVCITNPVYQFSGTLSKEKIELDPTTMLRIAKYNKSVELNALEDQIKAKTAELDSINDNLKRFNAKYGEIVKFVENGFRCTYDEDYEDDDY